MFGRVRRVSCSSVDELERPTAKLVKHDSLSIYESTLLKLKVCSQHASSFPNESLHPEDDDSMATEDDSDPVIPTLEEPMAVDEDASASASTSNCHEASTSKQHSTRQLSVTYLFSKFKCSKDASSPPDKRMNIESLFFEC